MLVSYNNGKDLYTKLRRKMLLIQVFLPSLPTDGSMPAGSCVQGRIVTGCEKV